MYKLIDSHLQTSLRHIRITEDTYNRLPFNERRLYRAERQDESGWQVGRSLLDDPNETGYHCGWSDNMDADF